MKSLDIVLKVSERCNLACTYCYFFHQGDQSFQGHTPVLKAPIIEAVASWLKQGGDELDVDDINIGFHGGEPLLMKKRQFAQMCETFRSLNGGRTHFTLGMQTNAALIDSEWIDLFEKYNVGVGISLDGPKTVNDASRVDHKGRGSYDDVVRGLALCIEAAKQGRMHSPGILTVMNTDIDPEFVYDHLVNDLQASSINFLFPREGHDSQMPIDGPKWREYIRNLANHYMRDAKRKVPFRMVSQPMQGMLSDRGAASVDHSRANSHNIITISSDGDLGPDDNLKPQDERFQFTGMTVFNTSMAEFVASPMWQEIVNCNMTVPVKCASCQWHRVCGSGEPFNRYGKNVGFSRESVFCDALDELHFTVAQYAIDHGISLDEIAERLAQTSTVKATDLLNAPEYAV